jgi:hypothetical protein
VRREGRTGLGESAGHACNGTFDRYRRCEQVPARYSGIFYRWRPESDIRNRGKRPAAVLSTAAGVANACRRAPAVFFTVGGSKQAVTRWNQFVFGLPADRPECFPEVRNANRIILFIATPSPGLSVHVSVKRLPAARQQDRICPKKKNGLMNLLQTVQLINPTSAKISPKPAKTNPANFEKTVSASDGSPFRN